MPYWFDGNNLIGLSASATRQQPDLLRAFLSKLAEYHRAGGGRFLVYFDGDDPGRSIPPPGVRALYAAPVSADDAIVERLRGIHHPAEVIVVTNDRKLQSRCRGAGAKALDWQQFTSKMASRKKRSSVDPGQDIDVQEWMDYFGIEDSGQ
jgi:predicted RNA-binding protein with PIN domain